MTKKIDGRELRRMRNRVRLIKAWLSFVQNGVPDPTAAQVAQRAGLSARAMFVHFGTMAAVRQAARQWRAEATRLAAAEREAAAQVDGRLLRGQRNRQRIIEAYRHFAKMGVLDPMGAEIAMRAGVSIRSVFHHFRSIAALRQAALTEKQWQAEAKRLRALPDRELVEAVYGRALSPDPSGQKRADSTAARGNAGGRHVQPLQPDKKPGRHAALVRGGA